MTEEVLVSVKGLHSLDNAQEDEVEVISAPESIIRETESITFSSRKRWRAAARR